MPVPSGFQSTDRREVSGFVFDCREEVSNCGIKHRLEDFGKGREAGKPDKYFCSWVGGGEGSPCLSHK